MSVDTAPIPDRALLLHVGMPKSGTTAIQRASAERRDALLAHGVRYPGSRHNHSQASNDVAGRRGDAGTGSHWPRLLDEVRGESERRVLLSHEFFAEHPPEVCRRIVTELERHVHVVFTVRNQPSLLGSAWQQSLKSGATASFDEWLEVTLGTGRVPGRPTVFDQRTELGRTVHKWVDLVGAEHVTLVVLDRSEPARLTATFESLLDLPRGLLSDVDLGGDHANRSLNAGEAELLRQVNLAVAGRIPQDRTTFRTLYRGGGIDRMLARAPAPDEPRIVPPQWAVDAMVARASQQVAELRDLVAQGVNAVGDLHTLAAPVPALPSTPPPVAAVPTTASSELAVGIIDRALELDALRREENAAVARRTAGTVRPAPPKVTGLSVREQVRVSTRSTSELPLRVLALATAGRLALRLRSALRGPSRRARGQRDA